MAGIDVEQKSSAVSRQFHLGWFLSNSYGVHGWNQSWGGTLARDWTRPDMQIDLAKALERACFDLLLLEDSSFVPDSYGASMKFYLDHALRAPKNDPLPLVPLIAQATSRLGIVPTVSTSFYPPFLLARLIATLDLMSHGRIGCNFVTSTAQRAAQNFGLNEHIEHDTRYEMADEFVEVVRKLWASWDSDAVVMDEVGGVFTDHEKVHVVDHRGRFFAARGPLNTAASPQRQPVLVQAGGSPQGRAFAARHMDAVVVAVGSVAEMKAFRADLRVRVASAGRNPDACKVFFAIQPTLGDTEEEAQNRFRRSEAARAEAPQISLALMASLFDIDFAAIGLDDPLEALTTNGQQGTLVQFLAKGRTLREIARNYRWGFEDLVGTPDQVARQMESIMDDVGGDGFIFYNTPTRRAVAEVTDGLVPALWRRGSVRNAYSHDHFRDNLMVF